MAGRNEQEQKQGNAEYISASPGGIRGRFREVPRASPGGSTGASKLRWFFRRSILRLVPTHVRSHGDATSAVHWTFVTKHSQMRVELLLRQGGFHLSRELARPGCFGLTTDGYEKQESKAEKPTAKRNQ